LGCSASDTSRAHVRFLARISLVRGANRRQSWAFSERGLIHGAQAGGCSAIQIRHQAALEYSADVSEKGVGA
jgi:hypothetical protein